MKFFANIICSLTLILAIPINIFAQQSMSVNKKTGPYDKNLIVQGDMRVRQLDVKNVLPGSGVVLLNDPAASNTFLKAPFGHVLMSARIWMQSQANNNWYGLRIGNKAARLDFTLRASTFGEDMTFSLLYVVGSGFQVLVNPISPLFVDPTITATTANSFTLTLSGASHTFTFTNPTSAGLVDITASTDWIQGTIKVIPILD
jgi:hypothetical protein